MIRIFTCFIFSLLVSATVFAQTRCAVEGQVVDSTQAPLSGITIKIAAGKDTIGGITNATGYFHLEQIPVGQVTLVASQVGSRSFSHTYQVTGPANGIFQLPRIMLQVQANELKEVVVTVDPIIVKEDTIQYNANAYKVREGAPVEDVIKKLPGVTVDKDGNITAQGKSVARVKVNGKDFFGGDVQTATQNLPANIIDNIQVIDDYGDQANLTGIKTGEPEKVININTMKNKSRGNFGMVTVGGGNDGRYLGSMMLNNFYDDRQISLLASINNTNANTFNFNGGGKGGGARGANLGSAERGGAGNGITLSKSVGLNYRDNWGKKLSVYGSYSFAERNNNTDGTSYQQDFNPMNIRSTNKNSTSNTKSGNHRLTWNMEYKMDTNNFFKLTPYASYTNSDAQTTSTSTINRPGFYTASNNQSQSSTSTPDAGAALFYNHKFRKRGRNLSINAGIDYSERSQKRTVNNQYNNVDSAGVDSSFTTPLITNTNQHQYIRDQNSNTKSNFNLSYTEPLTKTLFLEANYAWSNSQSQNTHDVFDIDSITGNQVLNPLQTNHYTSTFITNRYGLNLKGMEEKYNYVVGFVVQPSSLHGTNDTKNLVTDYNTMNWAPTARFVYHFAKSNSLSVNYGGASHEPSYAQLQPVIDSSNLSNIVIGNPNLKAEFTNTLNVTYNSFDRKSGNVLFANLSFDQTLNKIVNSTVNDLTSTSRTTSYLNTNGFYDMSGNASYSKPFSDRKYTVTVNASGSINNNISYTDNQRNNGQNWTLRPGARFRIDLPDLIDADLNGSYGLNKTVTHYPGTGDVSTQTQTVILGIAGKTYFLKNLTLGYDYSKTFNYGYGGTSITNPNILSLYLEYRFLKGKSGTLRFQGYDLFNQNTGITRTVSGTTITDSKYNRLARYYLLTFSFRFAKFTGKRAPRLNGPDDNGSIHGDRGDRGGRRGGGGGGRNGGSQSDF